MRLLSIMLKTCFWEAFSIDMVCPPQYKVTVALWSEALLSSCDHIRQRIHWVACYSLTDWNFKMGKRNHMFYDRAEREAQVFVWSPEDAQCSLAPVYVYDVCDHFREQLDSTQSDPSQPHCRSCMLPFYSWEESLWYYFPSSFHMLYVYRTPLQDRHEWSNGAVCHVYICRNKPLFWPNLAYMIFSISILIVWVTLAKELPVQTFWQLLALES